VGFLFKSYLHITADEQLARFKQRLDDPATHWMELRTDWI
jgi:polyphosphate kinase 2 (PPK2 family)